MQGPKISIITINYNNLDGLKRTVESVLGQTWREFEYIVIDGGSTDGGKEYIEEKRECFAYFVSEPDGGIYNAMNKGIKRAKGEYLLFLNSGDELAKHNILNQVHSLLSKFDFVYGDLKMVFKEKCEKRSYPSTLDFKFFRLTSLGHPATFIRRKLFYRYGFYDESLSIVSDWKFFMINILKNNSSYEKIDFVLAKFYVDGISSLNKVTVEEERNIVLRGYFKNKLLLWDLYQVAEKIRKRLRKAFKEFDYVKNRCSCF